MEGLENYIQLIVSSAISIIAVILSWWLKYKFGVYKVKKSTRQLSQSKLIQTILRQRMSEMDAQRAFILQRHNGGKFGNGKSMNKLSTTFEVLEEGVSAEYKNYQDLPITLYSSFIDDIVAKKAIYIDVTDVDDIITRSFFVQRGSKSAVVYPIYLNNDMIGVFGFEWTHSIIDYENMHDEVMEDGELLGDTLSKLL